MTSPEIRGTLGSQPALGVFARVWRAGDRDLAMVPGTIPQYEQVTSHSGPAQSSESYSELAQRLEQHVEDGLSAALALDLVLNELLAQVTVVTNASAGAIALARGGEMVCRATTGDHAPDLGVPLNTRDGLSGTCLRSQRPQICSDARFDSRVDAVASKRLGIRSMLVVPVMDGAKVIGIVEVFSPREHAFTYSEQARLEQSASDCARLRHLTEELTRRPGRNSRVVAPPLPASTLDSRTVKSRLDFWVMISSAAVIVAAAGLSSMIGSRTGWLRVARPEPRDAAETTHPATATVRDTASPVVATPTPARARGREKSATSILPGEGGLVVYEKGKVVFRMTPGSSKATPSTSEGASGPVSSARVWLAPEAAENRLVQRVEPDYPADAQTARRSGDVVFDVMVGNDGTVAAIRLKDGDAMFVKAAGDALRNWRYEPYRMGGHPVEFETEVTLKFALPH